MIVTLLAPVLSSSCFSAQGRADPVEPFLALGALDRCRVGEERQDLGTELDQARGRGIASLGLVGVKTLDELEHAIVEGSVRGGLRVELAARPSRRKRKAESSPTKRA